MDYYFNNENKYQTTINLSGTNLEAGFDTFGFGFVGNKLPLIFELRPLPIIGNILTKPGYETFADAIKERFYLEKQCGHTKCDDSTINEYSKKFDALFKDYFPSLTDDESDLNETTRIFSRKCLMEMRNVNIALNRLDFMLDGFGNIQ